MKYCYILYMYNNTIIVVNDKTISIRNPLEIGKI